MGRNLGRDKELCGGDGMVKGTAGKRDCAESENCGRRVIWGRNYGANGTRGKEQKRRRCHVVGNLYF